MLRLPIEEDNRVLMVFYENFEVAYETIERLALHLEKQHTDIDAIKQIAQSVNQLLLDAISSNLAPLVEPLEILFNVLNRIGRFESYVSEFSQPLMLLMDCFLLMARDAVDTQSVDFSVIQEVQNAIKPLARIERLDDVHEASKKAMHLLLNKFEQGKEELPGVEIFDDDNYVVEAPPPPPVKAQNRDQNIFHLLGETIDSRHKYWQGRCQFILPIVIGMNALADNAVDLNQLEAAVYLHDFPMVRLSDELLYKKDLSAEEFDIIKIHPVHAYELALAAKEWNTCAQIVYQHHERADGRGYPEGIKEENICDGAKILQICDAFHAMTHNRPYREHRRSIIRAIAEINACSGTQFSKEWVERFNIIARTQRIAKAF